ncbi:hypothetical protein FACS18945_2020 [Bacteroidia bacterium]|nr:hypothetical protein FACS18945_2020 [Bacteroidia bacterium]
MSKQLTILHLSDLHLTTDEAIMKPHERKQFKEELLKKVLEYQGKNKIDFVVVTGDIINQGNTKYFDFAKKFFKEIANTISLDLDRFIFVPGNHDAPRSPIIDKKKFEDLKDNQDFEAHILPRFLEFCKFSRCFDNNIYKKYKGIEKSFDVKDVELNGNKIRFILLNSALYQDSENEYKKLFISDYQCENIISKCHTEFTPDITFALMHHPLDWLSPNDKQDLMKYFETEFKIDILLHGHTHESAIYGDISLDYVVLNLVSGVGFPEKKKRTGSGYKPANSYRIAFYTFDIEHKIVDGNLYVTNEKLAFKSDTGRYNLVNNDGGFRITYKPSFIPNLENKLLNNEYEKLKSLEKSNNELEKRICNGVKYTENKVTITFDTENKKYDFYFKKKYQIISSEPEWFKGQVYCNTIPSDPLKSKDYYNNPKAQEEIKFEQLDFGAKISCWDKNGIEKFKDVNAKFICQAESANFKNFNIYYERAENATPLPVEEGDDICLEYNYSIPVEYWGSYINRTISYFKEDTEVELNAPKKGLLKAEAISIYYRTPDKRKENTPVDCPIEVSNNGKTIRIALPRKQAQYAIYWNAEEIFSEKGINTMPSRDNCQITKI